MAAGVGVFFVDGGGEHTNGAKEELVIFGGSLLEPIDKALDIAGHVVEGLSQFADFGGALNRSAFVEFAAANGAGGGGQGADGRADTHGKEIAENDCHAGDDQNESECLGVELFHA